ncbi:probable carbohydrate esterase At4g34215 [Actinidia eriantha]|uniref:probable carbohydrate esterase At4g34215 n=1 Tax=Actinidia eriantha TaxID=165200 RepID=UPI0025910CC7|nr:probable carbohydrate esterase At4g34215 [Actinidia eriantha]XP_057502172.1 probable carbohydrate esterase At4g34215 [Actinidia eriantha]
MWNHLAYKIGQVPSKTFHGESLATKQKAMLRFLWLLLLVYACLVSPASSQPKNIFLLAGQSNMSGRGGVTNVTWDGIVPPQCQPSPTILRLSEELEWVEATEPLHKDVDVYATCGVGPGLAFANSVLANDSSLGPVGLVPCAIGGTKISQWARGTDLYNQLVRRASAALQGGGTIRALLWYQGESDTINSEDAELYQDRLDNFFIDLRLDLPIPSLPIIQVALASGQGPFIEKVRAAQLGLNLDKVTCVDAKGLELEPDRLHLSTGAEVRLGEMLANEFLRTLPRPLKSKAHRRFHNFVGDLFNKPPV